MHVVSVRCATSLAVCRHRGMRDGATREAKMWLPSSTVSVRGDRDEVFVCFGAAARGGTAS